MTDRELMKLALESLDWAAGCIEPRKPINCDCPVCFASNALRERLAQPELTLQEAAVTRERSCAECGKSGGWALYCVACMEKITQPDQEPVAWRNAALRVGEDLCSVGPFGYYDMTAEQWLDWALSVVTVHAPPRREWVGLTEAEKVNVAISCGCADVAWMDFADAIEAKLKEKNA